jgi:hypothetical protein
MVARLSVSPVNRWYGYSTCEKVEDIDMDEQRHPSWCDLANCTAYLDGDLKQVHRTKAIVVPTTDGDTAFYIHANAGPDGAELSIEISELKEPLNAAFYAADATRYCHGGELVFGVTEAQAVALAIHATQMRIGASLAA